MQVASFSAKYAPEYGSDGAGCDRTHQNPTVSHTRPHRITQNPTESHTLRRIARMTGRNETTYRNRTLRNHTKPHRTPHFSKNGLSRHGSRVTGLGSGIVDRGGAANSEGISNRPRFEHYGVREHCAKQKAASPPPTQVSRPRRRTRARLRVASPPSSRRLRRRRGNRSRACPGCPG